MNHWAFLQRKAIGRPNQPMLTRYILLRTPWGGVYLHRIYRPDLDRDLHDHPWWFASLVLSGGYSEITADTARPEIVSTRTYRWFSLHRMPLDRAHYISEIHGRLLTLLVVSRRRQEWGFYTHDGFIPWREYTSNGTTRPGPDPFDS